MFYGDLYKEYSHSAQILKEYIKNLKNNSEIKQTEIKSENNREFYYRISILYSMYLDLKHISIILYEKKKLEEEK